MKPRLIILIGLMCTQVGGTAHAAETVTMYYDAKSRVVKSVRTGSVNNGVVKEYTHDKADNRKRIRVSVAAS